MKYKLIIDMLRGSKFTYNYNTLDEVLEMLDKKVQRWYDNGSTEMCTLVVDDEKEIETFVKIKKYCLKMNKTPSLVPFSSLSLGARFMYSNETENVWVKLSSDGTIAKWDGTNATTAWIGQPICSLNDTGNDELVKYVK